MALYTFHHDAPKLVPAFRGWVDRDLISDQSVFSDESLATRENYDALDRYFVKQPDAGEGSFYEKLKTQMASAPPAARKLMAEVLWALFLFPSNISAETKREGITEVWGWSGEPLDPGHPLISDQLLNGIGSAGMGVNTNRWREINYIVGLARTVKALPPEARRTVFSDYDRFMDWIETVPKEGNRQFRHMLRYFLFPDVVERMSSNGDRIKVLAAMKVAKPKVLRKWTDRQLDKALLDLRREMEARYQTTDIDFYLPPLREFWKSEIDPDDSVVPEPEAGVSEPSEDYVASPARSKNLILYGPPGTGKTHRLREMFSLYTDQPVDLDRSTWELGLVSRFGWRAVIAAALADLGKPVRVTGLEDHPIVRAKRIERQRKKGIRSTLWGYLQEHTPASVQTVNVSVRREPFVFTKNIESEWSLVPEWQGLDSEAEELSKAWQGGPGGNDEPVLRYRMVTFHPNYSYEDFVIGLRPVVADQEAESSPTEFRMMDGVFKQICAQAKANPGKRYALFIDEINRANIAKVFGELITLVEGDKRALYDGNGRLIGGLEVQLPGTSAEDAEFSRFGVPANLDLYGTMNTADRSIALLDIALRRRFEFELMKPRYDLLGLRVEDVDLGRLLRRLNDRLEFLGDRDRLIGHAYFMKVTSLEDLRTCFRTQIIPLLQEYFFDDWSRVQLVLSDSSGASPFLSSTELNGAELFAAKHEDLATLRQQYQIADPSQWSAVAFQAIYEAPGT